MSFGKGILIAFVLLLGSYTAFAEFTDSDSDLLPDEWELAYEPNGLSPTNPNDGTQDFDQDGLSNEEEYVTGKNPGNPSDAALSDSELLELTAWKAFLFFWREADVPTGGLLDDGSSPSLPILIPDNANFNGTSSEDYYSIAGIGFALTAIVVADQKGWVNHEDAYNRVYQTLSYFRTIQTTGCFDNDPETGCGNVENKVKHGYLFHWYAIDGSAAFNSEVSSIDHALFIAGALTAGQYYHGTPLEALANELYFSTQWNWMWNNAEGHLRMAWHPYGSRSFCNEEGEINTENGCWNLDHWDRYSELMILLDLAIGPGVAIDEFGNFTNYIPATTWTNIDRDTAQYGFWPNDPGVPLPSHINAGSLHNHQYSHMFLDLKNRPSSMNLTEDPINYFDNSMVATLTNRAYCIDLNISDTTKYNTYGPNVWGLSACNAYPSYQVLQPIFDDDPNYFPETIEDNNDSGTVTPFAPLGSMPFTPSESIAALNYMYEHRNDDTLLAGQALWGRYGFLNCFNKGAPYPAGENTPSNWSSTDIIGIDLGPIVGMIENYRSGLLWKYTHRSWIVKAGLGNMGFNSGYVEPATITFNYTNVGDTNEYGGSQGDFAAGAGISLSNDIPAGVGDGGKSIRLTKTGIGCWIGLNAKPIHQWDGISFWIKGVTGNETVSIGLKDENDEELIIPLNPSFSPDVTLSTTWTQIKVSFEPFVEEEVRLTQMDNISFTITSEDVNSVIFIDHLQFIEDAFPPAMPEDFEVESTGLTEATLTWDENEETDVVGYRIYRKTGNAADDPENPLANYTEITPGGVSNNYVLVGTSYTNTGLNPDQIYTYRITAVDNYQYPVAPYRGLESDPTSTATISTTDNDDDGLNKSQEDEAGTSDNDTDSDDDGIEDGDEVLVYQTDPINADGDDDGHSDLFEIISGTDPNDDADYASNLFYDNFSDGNYSTPLWTASGANKKWSAASSAMKYNSTKGGYGNLFASMNNLLYTIPIAITYDLTLSDTATKGGFVYRGVRLNINRKEIFWQDSSIKKYAGLSAGKHFILILINPTTFRSTLYIDGKIKINNELITSNWSAQNIGFAASKGVGTIDNIYIWANPLTLDTGDNFNANNFGRWVKSGKSSIVWQAKSGRIKATTTKNGSGPGNFMNRIVDVSGKDVILKFDVGYYKGSTRGGLKYGGVNIYICPSKVGISDATPSYTSGIASNGMRPAVLVIQSGPPITSTLYLNNSSNPVISNQTVDVASLSSTISFFVEKMKGNIQFDNFELIMEDAGSNLPPILFPENLQTVASGNNLPFAENAVDLEGDTLTFSSSNPPAGGIMNTNGNFSCSTPGSYTITIDVSDGTNTSSEDYQITVT